MKKKISKLILMVFIFNIIVNLIIPIKVTYGTTGSIDTAMNDVKSTCPDFKNTAMEKIKEQIEKGANVDNTVANKIFQKYSSDQDKILVDYNVYVSYLTGGNGEFKLNSVKVNLTADEIEKIKGEEVDQKYYYDSTISSSAANGQDPAGNKTYDTEEYKTDWADELGGMLLRPIFALVNFIADSVIKGVGTLMFPEAYGGIGSSSEIMTSSNKFDPGYSAYQSVEVDASDYEALTGDYYPQIRYTPEEIFSGQVNILSIDFISGKDSAGNDIDNEGWTALRKVIAQWYQALRLIAVIGLLSVLIYTGIKIMLSSSARDKAKYKEWIINWFIAVVLLFSMHYIMSFIITINSEISNMLYTSSAGIEVIPTGNDKIESFKTNLMGLVRFHILEQSFKNKIAYEIMYIALIVYTLKFTVIYLKRVMNMAFLTLIAPIVALTYPIDKINDGKAQGFEMWLKEYIFNALLQILHYLLYHILISSAIELAAQNPIYVLVVLGFMSEAERLLKKIFGFDKANGGTVGGMGAAFTAATVAKGFKDLSKLGGRGPKKVNDGKDGKIEDLKPKKVDGISGLQIDSAAMSSDKSSTKSDSNDDKNEDKSEEKGGGHINSGREGPDQDNNNSQVHMNDENKGNDIANDGIESSKDEDVSNKPIQEMANDKQPGRMEKIGNGLKNVGKQVAKPVWDFDKSNAYNGKRLARNIGRGAIGAGMGVAAAAVQAGISITDGKYNPMEAVGAFSAGYAGGGVVANKAAGVGKNFMDGYNMGDEEAQRKKAVEDFKNRDDVNAAFKKKYGNNWKEQRERAANNYYAYGETDVSQMMKKMDKADKLMKTNNATQGNKMWDTDMADAQMRNIEKARKELKDMNMYGKVMNDSEAAEKFVQSQVKNGMDEAKVRTLLSQMRQTK